MDFSAALDNIKAGNAVRRAVWPYRESVFLIKGSNAFRFAACRSGGLRSTKL